MSEVPDNPLDALRKEIPSFPTQERIDAWKKDAPGHRIKVFRPQNGQRAFLMRALSGQELASLSKQLPANAENPELELTIAGVARATLWTNITTNNRLDEISLRQGPAGLASSLWEIVQSVSDFYAPAELFHFSFEL